MSDFETAVAEAHDALVEAGHTWAQPRVISETERLEAARLPVEWISAPKPVLEPRTVRIRRIEHLAVRFASLSMMRSQAAERMQQEAVHEAMKAAYLRNPDMFTVQAGLKAFHRDHH